MKQDSLNSETRAELAKLSKFDLVDKLFNTQKLLEKIQNNNFEHVDGLETGLMNAVEPSYDEVSCEYVLYCGEQKGANAILLAAKKYSELVNIKIEPINSTDDTSYTLDVINSAIEALVSIRLEVGNGLKLSVYSQHLGYNALEKLQSFEQLKLKDMHEI